MAIPVTELNRWAQQGGNILVVMVPCHECEPDLKSEPCQVRLGNVLVDLVAKRVTPTDIRLTPTEWRLFEMLVRHPGRLLSRELLLRQVWGPGYDRATGNLRLYVAQLRRKLEPDPSRPRWFITVPGVGYRFEPDECDSERNPAA
jgi:two-component system, OmpR family, KDP operon response regulator KdpE